jgi:hypothetical protein
MLGWLGFEIQRQQSTRQGGLMRGNQVSERSESLGAGL